MKLKDRVLKWLGLEAPEPAPQMTHNLSRRVPRHEFVILQVVEPGVFKVQMSRNIRLLDMRDWRLFARDLNIFCMNERILWSTLEKGLVTIRCVGFQENLPKGIKYTWTFSKL